ncbi:MAG: histidine kinase [Ruminococcus sp.]|nr:histidine kinase [Ruminococcus sp.]
MKRDILVSVGIDYDSGVEKFLGEAELYESLLVGFLDDNAFEDARKYIEREDWEQAGKAMHAMKSVTGTLCMNELYRSCFETIEAARAHDKAGFKRGFEKAYGEYTEIARAITAAASA